VTSAQYRACVEAGACTEPDTGGSCTWGQPGLDAHPFDCVDWEQATTFAAWAGGHLPTSDEWDHAAKAGVQTVYAGSDDIGEVAWYVGNSEGHPHAVCGKRRSGYGLCDMTGNVWEWTSTTEGPGRVRRGGSCDRVAAHCVVIYRYGDTPASRFDYLGFRLARDGGGTARPKT
jgi:formylglycine-generating enzyme required for sulfatase activity